MTFFGPLGTGALRAAAPRRESSPSIDELPGAFRDALGEIRRATPRPEAAIAEIPAPRKLAPYAVALRAEVTESSPGQRVTGGTTGAVSSLGTSSPAPADEDAEQLAAGRFILLHDPAGQAAWDGTSRVVIYIRAELDTEMSNDPLLASVAWTWLADSLSQYGVQHRRAGGTATRILSESFGELADREASNTVELRASWTPGDGGLDTHVEAWSDMVCSFAGLPALPDGVVAMPTLRRS
ncbi:DUF3000 domain-containing protein [Nesterenkonia aerolata]|uniref:DUF3000 domain-containing protein n=1 Tax=Nesterenkonia aerolata TaxID=3074079 RepID=A0ABU2DRJ9_9MICC|nr:DUF3000 domain-containing protein [Nesterenkonia sp. LY-0111]MDR8019122.1 DUF3000 domain-containing protein [Nesterenkonia sp. LY-0111]